MKLQWSLAPGSQFTTFLWCFQSQGRGELVHHRGRSLILQVHGGPSWTHLRARLAHLGAMLAHLAAYVGPCWPIFSHKLRKMRKKWEQQKHRKTQGLMTRGGGVFGGRGGGPSLLRRGEMPYGKDTASSGPRGPLAGFKRLRATAGQGPMLRW